MSRILRARLRVHNPHTTNHPAESAGPAADLGSCTAAASTQGLARRRGRRVAARTLTVSAVAAVLLAVPLAASADPADPGAPVVVAANALPVVIANLQAWVMGILAAIATLYGVLGGVYRATAGGDPTRVEQANGYLKNALTGYALAVLAPVLFDIVKGIVGG